MTTIPVETGLGGAFRFSQTSSVIREDGKALLGGTYFTHPMRGTVDDSLFLFDPFTRRLMRYGTVPYQTGGSLFALTGDVVMWMSPNAQSALQLRDGGPWLPSGAPMDQGFYSGWEVASLRGGGMLVAGGATYGGKQAVGQGQLFEFRPGDSPAGRWTYLSWMKEGRWRHALVQLPKGDDRVLAVGGCTRKTSLARHDTCAPAMTVEAFDPRSRRWTTLGARLPAQRDWARATAMDDGRIWLSGGSNQGTTLLYEPQEDRWTVGPSLSKPRYAENRHVVVTLPGRGLMVLGGTAQQRLEPEIFVPGSDTVYSCPGIDAPYAQNVVWLGHDDERLYIAEMRP